MLLIPYEGSFQLSAYVESPGWQTVIPSGYVFEKRNGETWVASLLPSLFYGVNGNQLSHSWRQYLPAAGEQVILSRLGEHDPYVPHSELYWRKLYSNNHETRARPSQPQPTPAAAPITPQAEIPVGTAIAVVGGVGLMLVAAYLLSK